MERGCISGQVYQPNVNHRSLDHSTLLGERVTESGVKPSMITSLKSAHREEIFDTLTTMSINFYELSPSVDFDENGLMVDDFVGYPETMLKTLCCMHVDTQKEENVFDVGIMKNYRMVLPTGKAFKRALELFGYCWMDENNEVVGDDREPRIDEISAFCQELCKGQDFRSVKGLRKFLTHFGLTDVYNIDADAEDCPREVMKHLRRIGQVIRALQPLRMSAFEGQHRCYLLTQFLSGYLEPTNTVPLTDSLVLIDGQEQDAYIDTANHWHSIQIFRVMNFDIGRCQNLETRDLRNYCGVLRSYGKNVTAASGLYVPVTENSVSQEIIDRVIEDFDYKHTVTPDYESYWKITALKETGYKPVRIYQNAFDSVAEVLQTNKVFRLLFMGAMVYGTEDQIQHKFSSMMRLSLKSFTSHDLVHKNKYTENREGVPKAYTYFLQSLRAACHSKGDLRQLKSFMSVPMPRIPQRESITDHSRFRQNKWMALHINHPVADVCAVFKAKYLVERMMLCNLRNGHADPDWASMLDEENIDQLKAEIATGEFTSIPFWPKHIQETRTKYHQIKTHQFVNISKKSGMDDKMLLASQSGIFMDVIETINRYGFDPEIPEAGAKMPKNKALVTYLNMM